MLERDRFRPHRDPPHPRRPHPTRRRSRPAPAPTEPAGPPVGHLATAPAGWSRSTPRSGSGGGPRRRWCCGSASPTPTTSWCGPESLRDRRPAADADASTSTARRWRCIQHDRRPELDRLPGRGRARRPGRRRSRSPSASASSSPHRAGTARATSPPGSPPSTFGAAAARRRHRRRGRAGSTSTPPTSSGRSQVTTTALETLASAAGVCRDFAHLTICLLRGPRRARPLRRRLRARPAPPRTSTPSSRPTTASGGAWSTPPACPIPTFAVRICTGRDGADVPFMAVLSGNAPVTDVDRRRRHQRLTPAEPPSAIRPHFATEPLRYSTDGAVPSREYRDACRLGTREDRAWDTSRTRRSSAGG